MPDLLVWDFYNESSIQDLGETGPPSRIEFSDSIETSPLVKISGTTTVAATAVEALVRRHGTARRAMLEAGSRA